MYLIINVLSHQSGEKHTRKLILYQVFMGKSYGNALIPLTPLRVIDVKFPLQPHQNIASQSTKNLAFL